MSKTLSIEILDNFSAYAGDLMFSFKNFPGITQYAALLTTKVIQLTDQAKTDPSIDLTLLEKNLYRIGTDYIKAYSTRFRMEGSSQMH